ncbi:MAG: gamma carbonic anhydrase family protein [Bacillota bacterium]
MNYSFEKKSPQIHKSCFTAKSCDIIGDVSIDEFTSIWYKTVIRGDVGKIKIGKNTNVQDNSVVHVDSSKETIIGKNVTIGHSAVIHSCNIDDNVLIGMGAIILSDAKINKNVIIGAGSLVTERTEIPKNSLVLGSPAKVVRELTEKEIEKIKKSAKHYVELSNKYKK